MKALFPYLQFTTCSEFRFPFQEIHFLKCFQDFDGIQLIRTMPDDHDRSADARLSPGNWGWPQSFVGGRIRRMAAAAMAMALVQTIPVAEKAAGDV